MKKTTAILLLILTNVCVSADNFPATKPFVVPELKSWSAGEGTFVPGEELRVAVPSGRGLGNPTGIQSRGHLR